jgi:hypothetical protein
MYKAMFEFKDAMKIMNNSVTYAQAFATELAAQEPKIASRLADTSIDAFYDYLDGLARVAPGMLHHVYEWGEVGNPEGRLVELKKIISGGGTVGITSELLDSTSIKPGSNEPFEKKATIMEEGIPVTINEVNAEALFFEIDGEEFFRLGPITITNPGGDAVRGSFVKVFEEFYNGYFNDVYLRSIKYYEHFSSPVTFERNFTSAVRGNAASQGKAAALSWVLRAPGDSL